MTLKYKKTSVHLIAYNEANKPVIEQALSLRQYSDRCHPLLDDAEYRKALGIVRLSGTITDGRGRAAEEFEARFDRSGVCVSDAARLADGTVLGNSRLLQPT